MAPVTLSLPKFGSVPENHRVKTLIQLDYISTILFNSHKTLSKSFSFFAFYFLIL